MTNERHKRLSQFFGAYFHQDWDADGAKSWREVVNRYLHDNSRAYVLLILNDLRWWLEEAKAGRVPAGNLPSEYGCDYTEPGMTDVEWVTEVANYMADLAGTTDN